jgi:hypothetical protein
VRRAPSTVRCHAAEIRRAKLGGHLWPPRTMQDLAVQDSAVASTHIRYMTSPFDYK